MSTDGILLLHDVTEFSADLASDLDGGVRRAFLEWSETHRDRYHDLILEPPLWPNLCGLGIVVRRTARPVAEVSQEVAQVYQAVLTAKEAKIAQLEARLQRLESNWLLRRLYGGQNAR